MATPSARSISPYSLRRTRSVVFGGIPGGIRTVASDTRRRGGEWLGQGVKSAAAAADRVRPVPRGVVVLLYHRVGARSGLAVDLPVDLFEAQIAQLAQRRVLSLDDALVVLQDETPTGADPVVVTFD